MIDNIMSNNNKGAQQQQKQQPTVLRFYLPTSQQLKIISNNTTYYIHSRDSLANQLPTHQICLVTVTLTQTIRHPPHQHRTREESAGKYQTT